MSDPIEYQKIYLNYSDLAGTVPSITELDIAELAINTADGVIFLKKNDGTILTFKDASTFALAVHTHSQSDITGLVDALAAMVTATTAAQTAADNAQSTANTAVTNAATAQSGADASLKKASNLSDLVDVAAARTNLDVNSKSEVSTAIATAKSEAQTYTDTAITNLVNGADAALDTLKELGNALKSDETAAATLTTLVNGIDTRLTTAEGAITTAQADIVTAQSGADASLKKSSNLSDLTDAGAARTNLNVYSKTEVGTAISDAVSSASSSLSSDLSAVSSRVSTLEGHSLDSRLTTAEGTLAGLGTIATQDANNVNITGGHVSGVTVGSGNATLPSVGGTVLTTQSVIRGGKFTGF